jgi:SagB-type dehydrogenase family enzyme
MRHLLWLVLAIFPGYDNAVFAAADSQLVYVLPAPKTDSGTSVEQALAHRRSHRNIQTKELSVEKLSQILWAAYGITEPRGLRTAPSAGATYPLEIYVMIGNVTGITAGVYKYIPDGHKITRTVDRDTRADMAAAALGHGTVKNAPATIIYTAAFNRSTEQYGERGRERYVFAELGHSAQNIYLQAETIGLGTVAIGAFIDEMVSRLLGLSAAEEPLYLMPIGYVESN